MDTPSLEATVSQLAIAGEQAGISLGQMIELLDDGIPVDTLLAFIGIRLAARCRSLNVSYPHSPPVIM